jgi:hypothetical protein
VLPENSPYLFPCLVAVNTLAKSGCCLCFSSIGLVLNNCVDKNARASLNGLAMGFGSLSKTIGPFTAATLFAWTITKPRPFPMDFHCLFILVATSSLLTAFIGLPDTEDDRAIATAVAADADSDAFADGKGAKGRVALASKVNRKSMEMVDGPSGGPRFAPLACEEEADGEFGLLDDDGEAV